MNSCDMYLYIFIRKNDNSYTLNYACFDDFDYNDGYYGDVMKACSGPMHLQLLGNLLLL